MRRSKNGLLDRYRRIDIHNKSVFFTQPDQQDEFVELLDEMLTHIPTFISSISGIVIRTSSKVNPQFDKPYNTHIEFYCWCSDQNVDQGILISRSSNRVYSKYLIDATNYSHIDRPVSQSQLDMKARKHLFPVEHRTANWA